MVDQAWQGPAGRPFDSSLLRNFILASFTERGLFVPPDWLEIQLILGTSSMALGIVVTCNLVCGTVQLHNSYKSMQVFRQSRRLLGQISISRLTGV